VSGETIGAIAARAAEPDGAVVRRKQEPITPTGGGSLPR
jgi:hypothetical protein